MPRPINVGKRIKDLVNGILSDAFGAPVKRKGKPPVDPTRLGKLYGLNKLRHERPTRHLDNFAYVNEVLANMPAAYAAIRQLSEDVALDESGDPRAWNLAVGIDPLDDSEGSEEKISEFKDLAKAIFTDYALRTGIGDKAKNFVFKFLTAGDCFAEQTVTIDSKTGLGRIEKITELPTWQMHVIWDAAGDLVAYEQHLFPGNGFSEGANSRKGKASLDITWDIPAQIIHWKYQDTDYMPYGTSIFAHLRNRWEQFKLIELDTVGAIHTNAIDPEVHLLGNEEGQRLTDDEILRYKNQLRDNPTDINRFYVGRQGEVEYIFPKTGNADSVQKLVEAHRDFENRFVEAMVPGQVKSNAFDVARRAVATSFDQKYARKVTSIRQDFTRYLLASIFLEFALHGIDWIANPEQYGAKKITLGVTWPDISESRIQRSKRVLGEWIVGMTSHESSLVELGKNDPEGELDLLRKEHEDGDFPLQFMLTPANKASQAGETSPNDEQGRGVPADTNNASNVRAAILRSIFSDPEEIRGIIREELQSLLGEE